jgi:hypothetical protein
MRDSFDKGPDENEMRPADKGAGARGMSPEKKRIIEPRTGRDANRRNKSLDEQRRVPMQAVGQAAIRNGGDNVTRARRNCNLFW